MTIPEIQQLKAQLQSELTDIVTKKVKAFEQDTTIKITDVDVSMLDARTKDGWNDTLISVQVDARI